MLVIYKSGCNPEISSLFGRGSDEDQGSLPSLASPSSREHGPVCAWRWQQPPGWVTSQQQCNNIAWRLVPNQAHRASTRWLYPSNGSWCKWFNWLYFPQKLRCCSGVVFLKFPTIQLGRYVNNFHSSLECSQYLGGCNMGVDHFCWWLTFLWLVLCMIVLVTVGWPFSHEICYRWW